MAKSYKDNLDVRWKFPLSWRREKILKFTNPSFESLPKNEERLSLDETSDLFGSSFLHSMVKNADNDAKLRGVVHASGSGHRHSIHPG